MREEGCGHAPFSSFSEWTEGGRGLEIRIWQPCHFFTHLLPKLKMKFDGYSEHWNHVVPCSLPPSGVGTCPDQVWRKWDLPLLEGRITGIFCEWGMMHVEGGMQGMIPVGGGGWGMREQWCIDIPMGVGTRWRKCADRGYVGFGLDWCRVMHLTRENDGDDYWPMIQSDDNDKWVDKLLQQYFIAFLMAVLYCFPHGDSCVYIYLKLLLE